MNLARTNLAFLLMMMLLLISAPALTGMADLTLEDDLFDDDDFSAIYHFLLSWPMLSARQLRSGLVLGISVFALFVVYVGGRSGHKWFNDRSLDSSNFSRGIALTLKTALFRAVFNFLFFTLALHPNKHIVNLPILIQGGTKL